MSCSNIQSFHYPNEPDTGNNLCVLRFFFSFLFVVTILSLAIFFFFSLNELHRFQAECIYRVIYERRGGGANFVV